MTTFVRLKEQELVQDLRRRVEAAVDDKELHGGSLVFSEISEDPSFDKLRDDWLREIQASLEKGGRDGEPLHIENLPVMSPSQEAPGSHNSGGEADRMTSAGEWEDLLTSGRMTSASIGGDSEFGAFGGVSDNPNPNPKPVAKLEPGTETWSQTVVQI